ncbi:MAG: hypothetical protein N3A62_07125 [Thermodesulfovibrionales bacterium]|nr:hypothetical protein [Thermodesulfovibrionales bacterium]
MLIIGIAGAHSGSGKTKIAEMLLKGLATTNPLSKKRWAAIKYTKTELYWSVTDNEEDINADNKDTSRLSSAGAEKVVWIKSPPESLGEAVPIAMSLIGDFDGLIVEGNSLVEFLSPAVVVFLNPTNSLLIKPSSERILRKADIVINHQDCIDIGVIPEKSFVYTLKGNYTADQKELVRLIEDVLLKKEIKKTLTERSQNGRISCKEARRIAEELAVPYKMVGELANELKIKIFACELGCF